MVSSIKINFVDQAGECTWRRYDGDIIYPSSIEWPEGAKGKCSFYQFMIPQNDPTRTSNYKIRDPYEEILTGRWGYHTIGADVTQDAPSIPFIHPYDIVPDGTKIVLMRMPMESYQETPQCAKECQVSTMVTKELVNHRH